MAQILSKIPVAASLLALASFSLLMRDAWPSSEPPRVRPGEYLIQVSSDRSVQSLRASLQLEPVLPEYGIFLARRPVGERTGFATESLLQTPGVQKAEPNVIYSINQLPNDPELEKMWGLKNTGQKVRDNLPPGIPGTDIDAEKAWDIQTGSRDIVVAVIDTGIDETHPDLIPNLWTNSLELNGKPGIDDDGNGFVDDIYGYNFVAGNGSPHDDQSHGTHVAGTIGANANDGIGITGVAWNVRLMAVKFLDASGSGSLDAAVRAIDYATRMGARIMNNSWGGGSGSVFLQEAIDRAEKAGVVFVAAAGNNAENADRVPSYPAAYTNENIISVAAVDPSGNLAKFSNYGRRSVDVAAPGVAILSTIPGGAYKMYSGTSMATPHVSGIAALLLSQEPGLSAKQVKERIMRTAKPQNGLLKKMGSPGVASAFHALTDTVPPPSSQDPKGWKRSPYVLHSEHPYKNAVRVRYEVSLPGAKQIAIHFRRFELEGGFDKLHFLDADGKSLGFMTGYHDDDFSPVFTGDRAVFELVTDEADQEFGFEIDSIAWR